jgi:hypothetical protein
VAAKKPDEKREHQTPAVAERGVCGALLNDRDEVGGSLPLNRPHAAFFRRLPDRRRRLTHYVISRANHPLHVCKSAFASHPVIRTIRSMGARQGSYSHLHRLPRVTEGPLSGRNRTPRRLAMEQGYRALRHGSPDGNSCLDLFVDPGPRTVDVL